MYFLISSFSSFPLWRSMFLPCFMEDNQFWHQNQGRKYINDERLKLRLVGAFWKVDSSCCLQKSYSPFGWSGVRMDHRSMQCSTLLYRLFCLLCYGTVLLQLLFTQAGVPLFWTLRITRWLDDQDELPLFSFSMSFCLFPLFVSVSFGILTNFHGRHLSELQVSLLILDEL